GAEGQVQRGRAGGPVFGDEIHHRGELIRLGDVEDRLRPEHDLEREGALPPLRPFPGLRQQARELVEVEAEGVPALAGAEREGGGGRRGPRPARGGGGGGGGGAAPPPSQIGIRSWAAQGSMMKSENW